MAIIMTDVVDTLNHLVSLCTDGEKGYALAAEHEKELQHKELYRQFSNQRATMASELKEVILRLGGEPDKGGTLTGTAHRGWLGARAAITRDAELSIAAECERGEDAAKHAYEEALQHDLPRQVSELLIRQYTLVKEAHDRVKEIRDSEK